MAETLIQRRYCTICHSTRDLLKYGHSAHTQYFQCRRCCRERMRRYYATPAGRKRVRAAIKKSIKRHQDKQKARMQVAQLVRTGKMTKPKRCSRCKHIRPLDKHHKDYREPSKIQWVCRPCHADIHKLLKQKHKRSLTSHKHQ